MSYYAETGLGQRNSGKFGMERRSSSISFGADTQPPPSLSRDAMWSFLGVVRALTSRDIIPGLRHQRRDVRRQHLATLSAGVYREAGDAGPGDGCRDYRWSWW